MKLFSLVMTVFAVLALMLGGSQASPKGGGLRKVGKAVKAGIGAIGAIGTGHEIYEHVKNRG